MYFLNGLINIRNLLIISLLTSIIFSSFLTKKFLKVKEIDFKLSCVTSEIFSPDALSGREVVFFKKNYTEFKRVCESLQTYDDNKKTKIFYLLFDLDSITYFSSLSSLNHLKFGINDSLNKKNKNTYVKKNFQLNWNLASLREIFINENFKLKSEEEKVLLLYEFFILAKIKNYELLDIYSEVYIKLFNSNDFLSIFIIGVNIIILILFSILIYKIIFFTTHQISKKLIFLIILNLICNPFFCIYFLSFYKEPIVLLTFITIIFNYLFFLKKKDNFFSLIKVTIIVLASYHIISFFKPEYILTYYLSTVLSFILILINRKKIFIKNLFIQSLILTLFFLSIIGVINITNNIITPIKNNIIIPIKKNIKILNVDNKLLELELNQEISSSKQIQSEFENKKKSLTSNANSNYYFLEPHEQTMMEFKQLNCVTFVYLEKVCNKLNLFAFRIYKIKYATLWENNFFDQDFNKTNNNIINNKLHESTKEIFINTPLYLVKSYFMPFLFNDKILIQILSILKLISSLFIFLFCIYIFLKKKREIFFQIFGILVIYSPFLLSVELVTSNYFTYFRYIYPFNVFIILSLFLVLVELISCKENDKHFS